MSPEQAAGRHADARSDQYAFCVALWEALAGAPPFPGTDHEVVQRARRQGPPRWSGPRSVPRRCVEAMRRGLDPDPARRFVDMDALLAGLAPRPVGRWVAGAVLVAGLAGAVALGGRDASDICSEDRHEIEGAWQSQRDPLLSRIGALDVPYADTLRSSSAERLDGFIDHWVRVHEATCKPEGVRGPQTSLELACLELSKSKWNATVAILGDVTDEQAAGVVGVLSTLPDLDGCMDVEALHARGLIDTASPRERQRLRSVQARLHEAEAVVKLGDFERFDQVLREAESLVGPEDVELELRLREARATGAFIRGDYEEALERMRALREDAQRVGAWKVAARTANQLGLLLVIIDGQTERGLEVARSAVVEAIGADIGAEEIAVAEANLGLSLLHVNRSAEGIAKLEGARRRREEAGLGRTPNQAQLLGMLGRARWSQGEFEESKPLLAFR